MSQRRNRDRHNSNSTRRESSFHPYWNAISYYFINALRSSTLSTSSLSSASQESLPSPPPPLPPFIPQYPSLFPIPPPQNPHYYPNPINPTGDNSMLSAFNFTIESLNNLVNTYNVNLSCDDSDDNNDDDDDGDDDDDDVESHSSNSSNSSNSSGRSSSSRQNRQTRQTHQIVAYRSSSTFSNVSHVTSVDDNDDESYNGIKGKGPNFTYNMSTGLSTTIQSNASSPFNFNLNSFPTSFSLNFNLNSFPTSSSFNFNLNSFSSLPSFNFNLNSFPHTLSSLERYEIQIRIEGKITPVKIVTPHQLNKFLINCKKDHETRTNSQGNLYCKKKKNVYHYHNLSIASFYSMREDGSSIYVNQFGDITYKPKDQENRLIHI